MSTVRLRRRDALKAALSLATASGITSTIHDGALVAQETPPIKGTPRSPIVTRDGTTLFHQDWGAGRIVVFVAPWALTSDWWEYQMAFLADAGLRTIAYDRRGHGRSDTPRDGYEFDTLADDLASVMEQLDLRDVTLVGHSMGAAEVVHYLARHRARRVARVVLVAPTTPFILKTPDNPDGADRAALEKGRDGLRRDRPHQVGPAAAAFFGAPKNPVSAEMMDWWTRMILEQCSLRVMLELHRAFTETDFRNDLRAIAVPTLIIHGDVDTSARLDFTGRRTAALISGSELRVYEGAAHGLPITHMERLNRDLLAFAMP